MYKKIILFSLFVSSLTIYAAQHPKATYSASVATAPQAQVAAMAHRKQKSVLVMIFKDGKQLSIRVPHDEVAHVQQQCKAKGIKIFVLSSQDTK